MTIGASSADTPERLLKAARELFSRQGFDGTTVKELADHAGVNVSLVSYHFNGKEGLYRACLEQFGKERLAVAQRVLQSPRSLEDFRVRLTMFIEELLTCHSEQPEVTAILHREVDLGVKIAEDVFKKTFLVVFSTLVEFLKAAQEAGVVRKDFDPQILASVIFGSVMHSVKTDRVGCKFFGTSFNDPAFRKRFIETAIEMAISGCRVRVNET